MQKLGNIRNSSYVLLIYQAFGTEFANYCKFAAYATQVDQEIYETFLRYISIFYLAINMYVYNQGNRTPLHLRRHYDQAHQLESIYLFFVTQADYDVATDDERKTMQVCEKVLPPPGRYTPTQ